MNRLLTLTTPPRCFPALLFVLAATGPLSQSQTLQITSPADGTVVSPGQKFKVTVAESPSGAFRYVAVAGESMLGVASAVVPPYEFSVRIPVRITPRRYALTALGVTKGKQQVFSIPIAIDVERPDAPVRLDAEPTQLWLGIGVEGRIRVIGRFSDDPYIDLTQSTLTEYRSSALDVATVDAYGRVTMVGYGSAKITITNRGTTVVVPITVAKR